MEYAGRAPRGRISPADRRDLAPRAGDSQRRLGGTPPESLRLPQPPGPLRHPPRDSDPRAAGRKRPQLPRLRSRHGALLPRARGRPRRWSPATGSDGGEAEAERRGDRADRRDRACVHPRARALPGRRRDPRHGPQPVRPGGVRLAQDRLRAGRHPRRADGPELHRRRGRRRPPRVHHLRRPRRDPVDQPRGLAERVRGDGRLRAASAWSTPRRSPPTASTRTTRCPSRRTSSRWDGRLLLLGAEGRAGADAGGGRSRDSERKAWVFRPSSSAARTPRCSSRACPTCRRRPCSRPH